MNRFWIFGIGILLTLAVLSCSVSPPATQAQATSLALATVPSPDSPLKTPQPTARLANLLPAIPPTATPDFAAWSLETLKSLQNNRIGPITQVIWRSDGKALLAQIGAQLYLLERDTWQILWSIPADYSQIRFSPDGSQLFTLSGSQFRRLDAVSGATIETRELVLRGGLVAITTDGRFVAETEGGDFSLYDVESGQFVRALPADLNSGPILDAAFSADGLWAVAGSETGDLQAWDAQSGQRTLFRPGVIPAPVYECDVRGAINGQLAGSLLVVCSYPADDHQTVYYQVDIYPAGANAAGAGVTIRDNAGRGYSDFTVNADRSRLSVTSAGDIEIWSTFGSSRTRVLPKAGGAGMAFNPAAKNELVVWTERAIQVWDVSTGIMVAEWTIPGAVEPIVRVAFSPAPNRRLLILARESGLVEMWDVARFEKIAEWQANPVSGLAFTPDGAQLAVAQQTGVIAIFELGSADFSPQFEIQAGFRVFDLGFNPRDPRQMYVIGDSHNVHVWDVAQQRELTAWAGSNLFALTSLALRGDTLAAGTIAGHIPVWRAPGGEPFTELTFSSLSAIESLILSPDKSQIIFGQGNLVQVWQLSPRKQIRKQSFKVPVSLQLSPDGCALAVRAGTTVEILDAAQFASLAHLKSPSKLTSNLAFSSDGFLLAAGNEAGELILWGRLDALQSLPEPPPAPRCGSFSPPATPTATLLPTSTPIPSKTLVFSATPQQSTTFTPAPPGFTRNLFLADPPMRGEDVLLLQKRLFELGYTEVGIPDGVFGTMTDAGVRKFQERNNLDVDGYVGPKTWEALFRPEAVPASK